MEKGFRERVHHRITATSAALPLDVALLGCALEEAACIDINAAVARIAPSESGAGKLSFSDLTDAHLPLNLGNLFVQFHTASALIRSEFPGWLGLHIVSFDHARRSQLFTLLKKAPERIDRWHQAYAMVIYREWPLQISLAPAGMIVGLDEQGCIIDAAMFGLALSEDSQEETGQRAWEHVSRLTGWIVYLTFCVFTMVNQGEAAILPAGPRCWKI